MLFLFLQDVRPSNQVVVFTLRSIIWRAPSVFEEAKICLPYGHREQEIRIIRHRAAPMPATICFQQTSVPCCTMIHGTLKTKTCEFRDIRDVDAFILTRGSLVVDDLVFFLEFRAV